MPESRRSAVWVVETTYGSVNRVNVDEGTCTCADYEVHTHKRHHKDFWCKHRWAVNLKRVQLRRDVREIVEAGYFGGDAA